MRRAFVKDESVAEAAEAVLPDRPVSPHPNLVTETGLNALQNQLQQSRDGYAAACKGDDADERFRLAAAPLRDGRYYSERLRTAQLVKKSGSTELVGFGNSVSFKYDDGRVCSYRIVGEDEADLAVGLISYVSPVARNLTGKSVGDHFAVGEHELEILTIA